MTDPGKYLKEHLLAAFRECNAVQIARAMSRLVAPFLDLLFDWTDPDWADRIAARFADSESYDERVQPAHDLVTSEFDFAKLIQVMTETAELMRLGEGFAPLGYVDHGRAQGGARHSGFLEQPLEPAGRTDNLTQWHGSILAMDPAAPGLPRIREPCPRMRPVW